MTAPAPSPSGPAAGAPAPGTAPAAPAPGAPPADPATPSAGPAQPQSVDQLPAWAQKIITDARTEAGTYRTQLREAQTATSQQGDLLAKVAQAIGLQVDGKPDPEKLAGELTAAQQQARQTSVELAVYKAAGPAGGKADALLDSRSFMASVADLDPGSKTFAADVAAAVKKAVEANPALKAETPKAPAGPSGTPNGGGPGTAPSKPATLEDAILASLTKQ